MTFKVKGGIQIGANSAVDSDALFQQIEASTSVRPTLLLDFARSKTIDARLSFVRASNASYIAQDGLIRYVTTNQPRIEHDPITAECKGLLIEAGRANEQRWSENFSDNSYWSKTNLRVAENNAIAPDGTFTATRVYESVDATGTFHWIASSGVTISASANVTQSIYAKAGEVSRVGLYPISSSNGCWFNLSTGAVISNDAGTTATITPYPNGWYRCTATISSNATATTANPSLYMVTPAGTQYTGNNNTVYLWGHQFDAAKFASSYVPSLPAFTSRASNGTYYDSTGTLVNATTNVARYTYTPSDLSVAPKLLTEPASTNLFTYSEQLDHVNWGKGPGDTVTANTVVAPDGTTTAETYTKGTSSNYSFVRQGFGGIAANTTYTISCFVKKNNYRYIGLRAAGGALPSGVGGGYHAAFDFDTESFVANTPADYKTGFQRLANGWYRIFATINLTPASTAAGWQLGISVTDSIGYEFWDSTSGAVSVYVWGMQAEVGFLTSYIPTIASATRAADAVTISTPVREAEYVSMPITSTKMATAEGTMYLEAQIDGDTAGNQYVLDFGNGTTDALTAIRAISDNLQFVQYTAGYSQGSLGLINTAFANTPFKTAVAYSNTGWLGYANGFRLDGVAGPGWGVSPYGTITIGSGYSGAGVVRRMTVKGVSYYSNKLSNTELEVLTSS